jgi:predicted ATP-dependent protease
LDVIHIEDALDAKKRRSGRISQTLLDDIKEGQILIATDGMAVGKVNGLTVLEIGDSVFGTPARITSTVYAGSNGVIDIEREVELGQPIHSKGVMLLTGYLGNKFAKNCPLTLSANIALEQSYGHIDGDSASLGELVALISALTGLAIDQSLAITGSINQYGQVQSVGGVNEKIEGFFELCTHRGLTGHQGVIIPKSNMINLMLNKDVVSAVKGNDFHIYAVETVDQALELLTKKDAGEQNSKGRYPKGSINALASDRLLHIAHLVNGHDED